MGSSAHSGTPQPIILNSSSILRSLYKSTWQPYAIVCGWIAGNVLAAISSDGCRTNDIEGSNVMICPKCAAEMLVLTVGTLRGKVVVDRCSNCSGIWFDHGEAEALKEKWGSEYIDCGDPKVGRLYNTLRDIRCPICKDKMD